MTSSSATCCCAVPPSPPRSWRGRAAKDVAFYQGKIAAAKFFAANVLPGVATERLIAEGVDNSLMELDESAF